MKILVAVLLLILLGVGAWQFYEWRNQPPEVTFTRATRESISSVVSTNGKVDPAEFAPARAEASGRVDRILVKLRDHVAAGAPLVELDTGQLRHDLEAADARIAEIRAQLQVIDAGGPQAERVRLQTQIDVANVELRTAREEYDREVRLESKGGTTRQAVIERKNRLDQLESQVAGLKQQLASQVAPGDRTQLEARIRAEEASKNQILLRIQQTTVTAPIAGTIYKFDLKPGAFLNPGDEVASIGRLDQVHVIVYVDEPDLGRVRRGLPVTITWDAMPGREWTGDVDRLPTEVRALDTRQVGEVTCIIANPREELLPGTNVTARITAETVENAITIPKEAIFRENGQTGVYVLAGDKLEWRPATQGISNVTRTQVMELKEGDLVALPSDRVYTNGMAVQAVIP